LNGELIGTATPDVGGLLANNGKITISRSSETFSGKMDELRLWRQARTQSEIRENIYLPLSGNETGLVSYWQFNTGNGTALLEPISYNDGILLNMSGSEWLTSTIPFGGGEANTQIVNSTGNVTFDNTGITMNFTKKTGTDTIVVTRIDTTANVNPAAVDQVLDTQYWEIARYGDSSTFTADISFTVSEVLNFSSNNYNLYSRYNNSDLNWRFVCTASSVDSASKTITFHSLSNAGQYIIAAQYPQITLINNFNRFDLISSNFNQISLSGNTFPEICDIDHDGLLGLLIGEINGHIKHYEQASENSYTFGATNNFSSIDVGDYSTPETCDIDNDGLLDLLIGKWHGHIKHYEQAAENSYTFDLVTNNFNSINTGDNLTPEMCDIDHNGLLDLLIGEYLGHIKHYEQASENSYSFGATNNFNSINVGVYSTPETCDIDNDGLLDLLIGEYNGNINHYEQVSENSYTFDLATNYFCSIDVGKFSTPEICDIDHDGLLDLLIGKLNSKIIHYEQAGIGQINSGSVLIGRSGIKSYNVKGSNIISAITLTCSSVFQISKYRDSLYSQSLTLQANNGKVADTVYVKFTPTQEATYSDSVIHISTGAENKNLLLFGKGLTHLDVFPGDALEFDGNDDYVEIADNNSLDLTNNYTIEVWIKPEVFHRLGGIVSKYQGADAKGYYLRLLPDSPYTGLNFDGMKTNAGILEAGKWYHVAALNDNGTRKLYLNGELQNLSGTANTIQSNNNELTIGVDYFKTSGRYFEGEIDEVSIWNTALTQQQIRDNMHRTLTGNESGLVAYWQFNEGSGTSIAEGINGNDGTLTNMADDDWVPSTAPIPFVTVANGPWEQNTIWDVGQNTPVHPWSRVKIKHQVTLNSNMEVIEINIDSTGAITISDGDTLTVTGN